MSQQLRDVMTARPVVLRRSATVLDAARAMADADVGPVLVVDGHEALCGVVTDRDIVVRAVATGRKPESTAVAEVCTEEVATHAPSDSVADAARLMREHAVRRVPVVDEGKPVGIVSLTDLVRGPGEAAEREVLLTLADIASAPSDDPSTEAHPKASAAWETVWDVPAMAPAVGRRTTGAGGGHAPPSR